MRYIIAIIQPDRLDEVLQILEEKEIHLVTVTNVLGRGRQKGISEVYRGHKEGGRLLKKIKLEIAVNDEYLKPTLQAITSAAQTGKTVEQIMEDGDRDRWFTAQEALDYGFIDHIQEYAAGATGVGAK